MRVRWRSRVADIVRSGLSLAKLSETMKEAKHHGAGVERLVGCGTHLEEGKPRKLKDYYLYFKYK